LGIGLSAGILKITHPSPKFSASALTSVPLTAVPGYEVQPSFSPDGTQVAFTRSDKSESKYHIYVKLIGTNGPPLQLTNGPDNDLSPAWSPDGRFIAFRRNLQDKTAILLIPSIGGPERKITEIRRYSLDGLMAWSPDGNSIVVGLKDSPNE